MSQIKDIGSYDVIIIGSGMGVACPPQLGPVGM